MRPPKSEPLSTPEDYRRILGAGLLAGINDLFLSDACVDLLFENSGMMTSDSDLERAK